MIDNLDKSLYELLMQDLPPAIAGATVISFATPVAVFPPASVTTALIDLFLYDLCENTAMRDLEPHIDRRSDDTGVRKSPPVMIDCSYLVTVWPSADSVTAVSDEHRILGEIMKLLLRNPIIPEDILQGELKDHPGQLPRITMKNRGPFPDSGFWSALGIRPKAYLNFTVSFSVRVDPPEETGPLVMKHILKFQVTDDCSGMQKIEKGGKDG